MNILTSISQFFRRLLNRGKQSLASELRKALPQIEGALETAAIRWAAATGGEPLAFFVGVAVRELRLTDAARRFVESQITRLGAGSSRATHFATAEGRLEFARKDIGPMLAAIREEASKV